MSLLKHLFLLLVCLPLPGCYLIQAANGQLQLNAKRKPITDVLASAATPEDLRKRLTYVAAARDFASRELGLPDNASYRSYADVGRPYVVWNVFATDEFSVNPKRWCFPIAGCVVYRGYFSENSARRYALRLRSSGHDTSVGGVAAYSTLGHFKDPVLNTMMGWSDAQLAATLFHELAHQVVYVPGDSEFNEAFATVVEDAGIDRWLQANGRTNEIVAWRKQRERYGDFIALLLQTRERLNQLYASTLPEQQKRWRKQEEFGRLKYEYTLLKQRWGGYAGYDAWFDRALNNALLVSAATYHSCTPGLEQLLASVEGDLRRFYVEVRKVAEQPAEVRRARLCVGSVAVSETAS